MGAGPEIHDHLAELHVAGVFADAGWDIYFPRRDRGFDFIVGKRTSDQYVIRPVQVKGKYPTLATKDRETYGIKVELTETHPQMVIAIPFFKAGSADIACVAFAAASDLKLTSSKGTTLHTCLPAKLTNGVPSPRASYVKLFDQDGLAQLER